MWETWIPSVGLAGLLVLAMWIFSRGELEYQRGYWRGYEDGKCDEAARSEAAELRDRVAELERTNFELSEDSALVANENAELTESLKRLLDAVLGTDGHMGLIDMIDGYYGPCLGDAEAAIARAQAALAATEGQP